MERGKHQLPASHTHSDWGPNLKPRHVPRLGIELVTFCFVGQLPTNWTTLIRAVDMFSAYWGKCPGAHLVIMWQTCV